MDAALFLIRDGAQIRRFPLSADVTTIGRAEACDLRIPLGEISRKHCTVVIADDGLVIQDLGSSNGTFVNSKRVQQAKLGAGDSVRLASLLFVVQIDGKPAEEELLEFTEKTSGASTSGQTKSVEPEVDKELIDALEDDDDFP